MKLKKKYRLHPAEYAVAETERFYAEQAAKGWILESRGHYFSKFRRGEPKKLRYRMEFSTPGFMEEPNLPDAQIELYEECGWELVGAHGITHIFCASEDNAVPELYSTPEQQAAALKGLRKSYRSGLLSVIILVAVIFAMGISRGGWSEWRARQVVDLVRNSPVTFAYPLFGLWAIWDLIEGELRSRALYRRLKKGKPIDRTPKVRNTVFRVISRSFIVLSLACLLFAFVQLATIQKPEFPGEPGSPYLLLSEVGIVGEPGEGPFDGEKSRIEYHFTPLAKVWDVTEYVETEKGLAVLYQDVYQMNSEKMALWFAPYVVENAALADRKNFKEVEADGLDAAWQAPRECVAVKGNYIWYTTEILFWGNGEEKLDVLSRLAEK